MGRLDLWLEPSVHQARSRLPGVVRQRIKRAISSLADEPRPHISRALDVTGLDVPPGVEFRRLRLKQWRVIYALHEEESWIWVLGIRRRPPYDYQDLADLAEIVQE